MDKLTEIRGDRDVATKRAVLTKDEQLQQVEAFLREARDKFGQDVMYFEAAQVHFKLI